MRLTLALLTVVIVLGAACAPRPTREGAAAATSGVPAAPAPSAAPAPAATAHPSAGAPAPGASSSPASAAPAVPAPVQHSRQNPWRIPEGKLDEAKFIAISAKYTAASLQLSEKERTSDELMRVVLKAILKEANVTVEEYAAYADQVARDETRRARVSDAILAMAREHGAAGLEPGGSAQVTKMKALGKLDRQGNPVEDKPVGETPAPAASGKATGGSAGSGKMTDW